MSDPTTDDQTVRLIKEDPENPKNITIQTPGHPIQLVSNNGNSAALVTDRDIQTLALALHQFGAISNENGDTDMTQRCGEVLSKIQMVLQPVDPTVDEELKRLRYELWADAHDAWFGSTLPDEERLCIVLAVAEEHGTLSTVTPEDYLSVRPYDDPTSRQTAAAPVDGGSDPTADAAPQTGEIKGASQAFHEALGGDVERPSEAAMRESDQTFSVGDIVIHSRGGKCQVTGVKPSGGVNQYEVSPVLPDWSVNLSTTYFDSGLHLRQPSADDLTEADRIYAVLNAPEGTPVRHADGWSGTIAGARYQKDKPAKVCVLPNDTSVVGVEAFSARPSDLMILPSDPGPTEG